MFDKLKKSVQERFAQLAKHQLFVVPLQKNELFAAYLGAIPEDKRQENNCNCCRRFLNSYGNIVAVIDGQISTMWDFDGVGPEHGAVPEALRKLILSKAKLGSAFVSTKSELGIDSNLAILKTDGSTIRYYHFALKLPDARRNTSRYSDNRLVGEMNATRDVFRRSLEEISQEAIDTVIDLANENAVYRLAEHKAKVLAFSKHKQQYMAQPDEAAKELFVVLNANEGGRIRNSSVGTLLVDLSNGVELEDAVRLYEKIMAPANHQRTAALVTPAMVERARKDIDALGYTSALQRRHATIDDVPLEHLLYVSRDTVDRSDVFNVLASEAVVTQADVRKATPIKLDDFLQIATKATVVQLYTENTHNYVSLLAPVDPDAKVMFPWGNAMSWTYANNMTDAVKEKVKNAGGSVTGALRASLEWFNHDDLDIYLQTPHSTSPISFREPYKYGGHLDVDMNRGYPYSKTPVENITFADAKMVVPGKYKLSVHNWSRRDTSNVGFNAQIEFMGQIYNFSHPKGLSNQTMVTVAEFTIDKAGNIKVESQFGGGGAGITSAGVAAGTFTKVNMLMLSPNYWGANIGNKHLIAVLDGAKINEPLRPFFNEYLRSELKEHRKVFEMLGNRLMVQPAEQQLTGVGLSSTQNGSLTFKVDGRLYRVEFN